MTVRTRFAPSPTGKPHIGNIRTAIFEYLYAKSKNGEFILRIEDTDRERFIPETIKYIEESLKWLGLTWDNENIVHQSTRLDIYKKYSEKLLEEGKAYKCFCSKERLAELREKQTKEGKAPGYDACCRKLNPEDVEKLEKGGKTSVLRFKIPETPKKVIWEDLVWETVSIRADTQEDFIIMKSDGYPTYNFANVIDDHDMGISHVIRGEEFIPSTPKHILLYLAFGWQHPSFAHLPLIIGKDKKKLSKRHGDTDILDYREEGYLAESMLNFLVLLGWNLGTTQELFSCKELIKYFDIKRVGKAPAVFDLDRLNWINGEKIRAMKVDDLIKEVASFNSNFMKNKDRDLLQRALIVMQTRMVTLKDFTDGSGFFFEDIKYDPRLLIFKKSTQDDSLGGLKNVLELLGQTKEIKSPKDADKIMKKAVASQSLSNGDVFWPVRVALSGQEKSPSPGEIMWALGLAKSKERLETAVKLLENP